MGREGCWCWSWYLGLVSQVYVCDCVCVCVCVSVHAIHQKDLMRIMCGAAHTSLWLHMHDNHNSVKGSYL